MPAIIMKRRKSTRDKKHLSLKEEKEEPTVSSNTIIIGRNVEKSIIIEFLNNINDINVLYICGNPGTGKTALVKDIISSSIASSSPFASFSPSCNNLKRKYRFYYFNCMMYENPSKVLLDIVKIKEEEKKKRILPCLVLDEVDQLALSDPELFQNIISNNNNSPLYHANNASKGNNGSIDNRFPYSKLICIANNLNLTIKYDFDNVKTIYFTPYQIGDIQDIIKSKLSSIIDNDDKFKNEIENDHHQIETSIINTLSSNKTIKIDPMAIELCARKVATIGDLRKALQIINEVIASFSSNNLITIENMLSVLNKYLVFTLPSSKLDSLIKDLNIHQRLVLVSLLILIEDFSSSSKATITLQVIYEKYQNLAKYGVDGGKIIDSINRSDFYDVCNNLESIGLIKIANKEDRRGSNKIAINISSNHNIKDGIVKITWPIDELIKVFVKQDSIAKSLLSPSL